MVPSFYLRSNGIDIFLAPWCFWSWCSKTFGLPNTLKFIAIQNDGWTSAKIKKTCSKLNLWRLNFSSNKKCIDKVLWILLVAIVLFHKGSVFSLFHLSFLSLCKWQQFLFLSLCQLPFVEIVYVCEMYGITWLFCLSNFNSKTKTTTEIRFQSDAKSSKENRLPRREIKT